MQTVGTCWIRLFINNLLPSQTSWQVPVQPVLTNFCLQRLHSFPRTSPLIPDYPYTIRKTVLRSVWWLLDVKPFFLPWMEEMIPTLCAAAFRISKSDQCVSFTLQLFTRPNSPNSLNLYLWDVPARSPITALHTFFSTSVCAMQRSGHKMQGGARRQGPLVRRREGWLCVLLIHPWVTSTVFTLAWPCPSAQALLWARFPFILQLLMKILNKRNCVDPHKFTTNTNDAVFVTDLRAQSKQSFLTS